MDVLLRKEENQIDLLRNLFEKNCEQNRLNIYEQTLKKYDQNNQHFSIQQILIEENILYSIIGFDCIYQYQNQQIQFKYLLQNQFWKRIDLKEEKELDILLEDINNKTNLSFEEQIQLIINKFDQYFFKLNEEKEKNLSKPSTIIEVNEEQIDFPIQSELVHLNEKSNRLTSPMESNRIRQDSSCSSTNSIKYTQFVPPSTTSIRRRRVIQSIHLHVQRKKKFFQKFVDQLKQKSPEPTMYQLGAEFLRQNDGKFNYPLGHRFIMSFNERIWFLTIKNIKCVECQLGQPEPRSILLLQYKNKCTTVQL